MQNTTSAGTDKYPEKGCQNAFNITEKGNPIVGRYKGTWEDFPGQKYTSFSLSSPASSAF